MNIFRLVKRVKRVASHVSDERIDSTVERIKGKAPASVAGKVDSLGKQAKKLND